MGDEGMKKWLAVLLLAALALLVFPKTTITLRHAMSGQNLKALEDIVKAFNETHPDIEVVPVFTGSYAETLTKAIAAYRNNTHPHIVQVYEVGFRPCLTAVQSFRFMNLPKQILIGETSLSRYSITTLWMENSTRCHSTLPRRCFITTRNLPESGIRPQQAAHDL